MKPMRQFLLLIGVGVAFAFAAGSAQAIEYRPYTPDGFAEAQAAGGPIVIDVHAVWCPTCQAQRAVIDQLAEDPRFDNVIVFVIDYDNEKQYMRMHRVAQRSTLISFVGGEEIDRLYAVTTFDGIQSFFLNIVE